MAGRVAAVAVVMALLAGPSSAWYQLHGDPDRNAVWVMPDGPLDVQAHRNVLAPDESLTTLLGPNFSLTLDGLVTVARNTTTEGCTLVRVPNGGGAAIRTGLDQCRAPWFQGYDPIGDTVFVCSVQAPDQPVLQARSAQDGALRWGVVPNRDLMVADVPGTLFWGCSGVAFDFARREAVVPFINARTGLDAWHHRVAAVDLDTGAMKWVTQIPLTAEVTGGVVPVAQPLEGSGFYILPLSATLTSNGPVVTAIVICPDVVTCDVPPADGSRQPAPFQTAAAWLDNNGIVQGLAFARRDVRSPTLLEGDITSRTAGGAFWASAQGTLAVASLGGSIFIINPESKDWLATTKISTIEQPEWGVDSLPAPVWADDMILAPFYRTLTAFDPVTLEMKWRWPTTEPWLIQDLLAAPGGDVYVLIGKSDRSSRVAFGIQGNESMVVRLDRVTGHEKQRLPINVETWMTTEPDMRIPVIEQGFAFPRPPVLVPIPGGVAVSDLSGHLVELGPPDGSRRPTVEVDDPYPPVGTPLSLRVPPLVAFHTERVLVQWGDGSFLDESSAPEPGQDFTFRHVFGAPQRHEVLITAVYDDGTTGTTAIMVDVGGTPPPTLNPLQLAFARENLDMTFGVLGIAIAVAGGLYGGNGRLRRRARLRQQMRETQSAFDAARGNVAACESALDQRRSAIQTLLQRGRLDEAQTAVLDRQIDELRRQARIAPLDDRFDFLPRGLARRLEAMLADGRVSQSEHDRFITELEADPQLSVVQKSQVRDLLAGWRRHDSRAEGAAAA